MASPWTVDQQLMNTSRAAPFFFALILAQITDDMRTDYEERWWRTTKHSADKQDDHNDGFDVCSLAAYGLIPYELALPGRHVEHDNTPTGSRWVQSTEKTIGARDYGGRHGSLQRSTGTQELAIIAIYGGQPLRGTTLMRGTCGMLRSACWRNLTVHFLHAERFHGLGQKVKMIEGISRRFRDDGIRNGRQWVLMFIDSFDTLLQLPSKEILQRFSQSKHRVLLAPQSWTASLPAFLTHAINAQALARARASRELETMANKTVCTHPPAPRNDSRHVLCFSCVMCGR